ncbi:MAG: hypothetical protein PHQ60_08025 [Sideroxydans sp.]|nr:hypothetical protein [Sideroxydans sp.]
MMIYLSAAKPLSKIEWNEAEPRFYISTLAPNEERVSCQFKTQNVVYAGSYEGCGCGFQYGEYPAENYEPDELKNRRRSLDDFAKYLRNELPKVGAIELFACWDGDQEAAPEHRRSLTPASLEANDFFFFQKECSTLTEDSR